jgi:ferrous iron transport protein B
MATRTIEDDTERKLSAMLVPFMPCSAKMVVFGWISHELFGENPFIATSTYFLSLAVVCISGWIISKIKKITNEKGGTLVEMPFYRVPPVKDVLYSLIHKTKEFLLKAGMIIFVISVILWALKNLGVNGYTYGKVENSFLFSIGNSIRFVFYPLGFGSYQASVAVLSGFMAKEAVVETLRLITTDVGSLFANKFSAYSFMTFLLLSPPCIASMGVLKDELGNKKLLIITVFFEIVVGYFVSLLINMLGAIIYGDLTLIFSGITVIIITLTVVCFYVLIKNRDCRLCGKCNKGDKRCKRRYTI